MPGSSRRLTPQHAPAADRRACEAFLSGLADWPHAGELLVHGAVLCWAWVGHPPTDWNDFDLIATTPTALAAVKDLVRSLTQPRHEEPGMPRFDAVSSTVEVSSQSSHHDDHYLTYEHPQYVLRLPWIDDEGHRGILTTGVSYGDPPPRTQITLFPRSSGSEPIMVRSQRQEDYLADLVNRLVETGHPHSRKRSGVDLYLAALLAESTSPHALAGIWDSSPTASAAQSRAILRSRLTALRFDWSPQLPGKPRDYLKRLLRAADR